MSRYVRASWAFVAYTVLVIVWGAVVRATLSGAGCGDHWPMCNGEIVPVAPSVETMVEFTHRLTSGLAWIFAFGFVLWSRRAFAKGHLARRGAALGLVFMTTEALIGAGLVLTKMVADNPDAARGWWAAAHLLNTFALLTALTLHAHWANGGRPVPLAPRFRAAFALVFTLLAVVGATGAIAALGDTLFPAASLRDALAQDVDAGAHIFLRLRTLHPVFALAAAAGAMFLGGARFSRGGSDARLGLVVASVAVLQTGLGFLNVMLLAPTWLQLVHLVIADGLWIGLVLLRVGSVSSP